MTANNMEAAVMRTPLVAVAVAEVSPSAVPEVAVVVSSVEVVAEVSAIDSQVDDEEVVDPKTWVLESQTVQTVAEEQVMHPAAQAVQASTAVAVAAVAKFPEAGHSQAWVVPTRENPVAQTHPAEAEVQEIHPLAHGYWKKLASEKYPLITDAGAVLPVLS